MTAPLAPDTASGAPARASAPSGDDHAWLGFLALGLVLTALFLLLPEGDTAQAVVFTAASGAATGALALGIRRHRPAPRAPWLVLLGAEVVYTLCLVGWYIYPVALGGSLAYPSPLDAMYWLTYLGWAAFLLWLTRERMAVDRGVGLDAIMASIALGCIGWELLLEPVVFSAGVGTAALTATTVYTLLLITLACLAARVALLGGQPAVPGALLLVWVGLELAGDVAYGLTGAAGTFGYGADWFALWLLSYTALGALALRPDMTRLGCRDDRPASSGPLRLVLLGSGAAVPLYLVVDSAAEGRLGATYVFAVLTLAGFAVVLARLQLARSDLGAEHRLRAELARVHEQLLHEATHDRLTGLANRTSFDEALDEALVRTSRHHQGTALVVLDLDSFKAVNDTYGPHVGDRLLAVVAERVSGLTRPGDPVARLGGDEFAVLLHRTDVRAALRFAERVADALAEPVRVADVEVPLGASVGVHMVEPGQSAADALVRGDAALDAAKVAGGGVRLYDPARHHRFIERSRLEAQLRAAPTRGELVLHYQPVLELVTRRPIAAEALLRWDHPARGLIGPAAFMDVAEESGAIVDLGRWALRRACRDAARWRAEVPGAHEVRVAVNVSRRQFEDHGLVDQVTDALRAAGLPPSALSLEVTETALSEKDDVAVAGTLATLRGLGVEVALDDFGTGYSSLAALRTLPVDVLKVDKAFVDGIAKEEQEWALAAAIFRLAGSLGKRTVAEGIERGSQLAHLRTLGCALGQGYLFARPMPLEELTGWLAAQGQGDRRL